MMDICSRNTHGGKTIHIGAMPKFCISPLGMKMEHDIYVGGQSGNTVISPRYRLLYSESLLLRVIL